MLKMFRGRDRRSQGGVSHNDVQIFKHLEEADVDSGTMIGKAQTWDCSVEDQLKKRTPAAGKCQCSAALMQFNKP